MTQSLIRSSARRTALVGTLALFAACGRQQPAATATADDALRNDLTLATQAQQNRAAQQVVSPQELNGQPYQAGSVAAPAYAAPAPPRVVERVVYRDRPVSRRSSSSGGSYASSEAAAERAAAREARAREEAAARRRGRAVDRQQGAVMGGIAGAAIGAATAKGGNRVKNGVIGAVAGSVLGGVIGNNQKRP